MLEFKIMSLAPLSSLEVGRESFLTFIVNLIDVLVVIVPMLLAVAFMTIIERKQLASMQRRVGPNTTGYYGILQPFLCKW